MIHVGNIFTSARKLDERSFYVALDSDKKQKIQECDVIILLLK